MGGMPLLIDFGLAMRTEPLALIRGVPSLMNQSQFGTGEDKKIEREVVKGC